MIDEAAKISNLQKRVVKLNTIRILQCIAKLAQLEDQETIINFTRLINDLKNFQASQMLLFFHFAETYPLKKEALAEKITLSKL